MTNTKTHKWKWLSAQILLMCGGIFVLFPVLLLISYLIFIWVMHDYNPYFFYIDSCLDLGGRWNYEINDCEGSESYREWKDRTWY